MLPFSLACNHLAMESFIFRTIAFGRSATTDCDTSDAETGGINTGDKETKMHCLGGAVEQVILRQVMSKLVMLQLVTEGVAKTKERSR